LPSYSEGTPNVVKEAMACARPVIATNVGGIPELIEHGVNGLLFEPGDHKTLSDHITYLAENREVVREMGLKGRQFIIDQDLTWENTAKQYMKIYKNILEQQ
jgi:glycosyltransferase involved in cell wall biosynthesis